MKNKIYKIVENNILFLLINCTIFWAVFLLIIHSIDPNAILSFFESNFSPDGKIEARRYFWFKLLFFPHYCAFCIFLSYKIYKHLPSTSYKYLSIYLIFFIIHYFYYENYYTFEKTPEDDFFEWTTTILALCACLLFLISGFQGISSSFFVGILVFLFAMEEISWGQRILEIEVGEFIEKYNHQSELNIHNFFNPILSRLYLIFFLILISALTFFREIKLLSSIYQLPSIKFTINVNDKYSLHYPLIFCALFSLGSFNQFEFLEQQFSVFSLYASIALVKEFTNREL